MQKIFQAVCDQVHTMKYDAKMSDETQEQTILPRVEELAEATGLDGEKLRNFLITMVQKQFSRISDDPIEIMMGGLTIGAMIQTIANDMIAVGAPQKIIDAIDNVREACDMAAKACEEDGKNREASKKEE